MIIILLGVSKIEPTSDLMTDIHFESGVCKIQTNVAHLLINDEKDACEALLIIDQAAAIQDKNRGSDGDDDGFDDALNEAISNNNDDATYHNCDFILGSVAEVERLWSLCKYVFTDIRQALTPETFEAIIFLKVNKDYWNQDVVTRAYRNLNGAN